MTRVAHTPGCVGDQDEAVNSETSSNAAPGTAFRSYRRYICTMCGVSSQWERVDPWRFKFPDKEGER